MEHDRSYYELVTVGIDIEFDFLQTKISEFQDYLTREPAYIRFASEYVGRLDLLSYKAYDTPYLWWVLALANGIDDPFDDALVDVMIMVPDLIDVYRFYADNYVSLAGVT